MVNNIIKKSYSIKHIEDKQLFADILKFTYNKFISSRNLTYDIFYYEMNNDNIILYFNIDNYKHHIETVKKDTLNDEYYQWILNHEIPEIMNEFLNFSYNRYNETYVKKELGILSNNTYQFLQKYLGFLNKSITIFRNYPVMSDFIKKLENKYYSVDHRYEINFSIKDYYKYAEQTYKFVEKQIKKAKHTFVVDTYYLGDSIIIYEKLLQLQQKLINKINFTIFTSILNAFRIYIFTNESDNKAIKLQQELEAIINNITTKKENRENISFNKVNITNNSFIL
ncbi:hypothetical protein DEFDS_P251 (plasmid) [Deferribacter desulfuricans SSM1]|uniref:Uncharacterized protein n=1 Tax=Deferribacter desulfuricans (strain DSM 14783 / JCM 11476 / NBRC 101012 / SSM1) TaxID=639282 RepID=D3PF79_DEFDS|nr:hypothetical protein [Deferribacter desulfuricans]BAI81871.1 hypothetical protein DEFDS_P251 [Deferribacter desulfuricans SSM1]